MCSHQHHDDVSMPASESTSSTPEDHDLVTPEPEPRGLGARLGVGLVRGYQRYISAYTPPMCRFYPTCSQYTLIAIKRYGLLKGSWLGAWRIMRCHPFHPGGIDHVP